MYSQVHFNGFLSFDSPVQPFQIGDFCPRSTNDLKHNMLAVYWNVYSSGRVFMLRHSQDSQTLSPEDLETIATDLRNSFTIGAPKNDQDVAPRNLTGNGDDILEVVVFTWYNMVSGVSSKKVRFINYLFDKMIK